MERERFRNEGSFARRTGIDSDSAFIFHFLIRLITYFILFIPRLFSYLYLLMTGRHHEKRKHLFSNLFLFPLVLWKDFLEWFFQAGVTAFLFVTLFIMFFLQLFFITPDLYQSLMTHPLHLFEGNYHSIVTSIFLHGSIFHLLSNLLALLIFGRIVERDLNFGVLFVFIGSGVIANLFSHAVSLYSGDMFFSLGASGGVAGLIIMGIILHPFSFTNFFIFPLPLFLVGWALIFSDITGLTNPSNINHYAHIGGYIAIAFLFYFFSSQNRSNMVGGLIINLAMLIALFLALYIFGIEIPFLPS